MNESPMKRPAPESEDDEPGPTGPKKSASETYQKVSIP